MLPDGAIGYIPGRRPRILSHPGEAKITEEPDPDATGVNPRNPGNADAPAGTLAPGQRFGVYEILGHLGFGAMGEVYRARDTRLDREVAIKVLPRDFAADDERRLRFEREAKALASLNHSNIAQIYTVSQVDNTHFLSLELVPGETLEGRLESGPLAVEDALRIGRDIAEGLETAHEAGVIHRDLKPANVRVTPEGATKILDFGLAKSSGPGRATSSTQSMMALREGRLLGTPTYMAPEQVQGKPTDRRVDVWAFGCVLYECLTGRRPFVGDSLEALFGAIVSQAPDLAPLGVAPPRVRGLIERCLRKDPRGRLRDLGDARVVLEEVLAGEDGTETVARAPSRPVGALAVSTLLLGLLLGALLGRILGRDPDPTPPPITRYSIALPPAPRSLVLDSPAGMGPPLAISSDGRQVVFAGLGSDGVRRLYRRTANEPKLRFLRGTEEAEMPIFSPDGKYVAYTGSGSAPLYHIALADESIREFLDQFGLNRGMCWTEDDWIVFGSADHGLARVSSSGGEPEMLTHCGPDDRDHRWPQVLPGGKRVLFTASLEDGRLEPRIYSLETDEETKLTVQGSYARYLSAESDDLDSGFLLYVKAEELWAVRLDVASGNTQGDAKLVVTGIQVSELGVPHLALSPSGVLVYEPMRPPSPGRNLVWVDRVGEKTPIDSGQGYEFPRISPDGRRILFADHTEAGTHDVCALDWKREPKTISQITSGGNFVQPNWSPRTDAISFSRLARHGAGNLYVQELRGAERPQQLTQRRPQQFALQWLDEDRLLFQEYTPERGFDLLEIELTDRRVKDLIVTEDTDRAGRVSPDGRWLAYISEKTGLAQVVLRSYPDVGREIPVTRDGGDEPVWSPVRTEKGRELFFRRGPAFFVAEVSDAGEPGVPQKLFEANFVPGIIGVPNYDVTADGQRFVMVDDGWDLTAGRLDLHLQFRQELEEALPPAD